MKIVSFIFPLEATPMDDEQIVWGKHKYSPSTGVAPGGKYKEGVDVDLAMWLNETLYQRPT